MVSCVAHGRVLDFFYWQYESGDESRVFCLVEARCRVEARVVCVCECLQSSAET